MSLLAMFTTGLELPGFPRFLLMVPLCLSVAIIYKATRLDDVRQIPKAVLALWVTIVLGMVGVGVGMWVLFTFLV